MVPRISSQEWSWHSNAPVFGRIETNVQESGPHDVIGHREGISILQLIDKLSGCSRQSEGRGETQNLPSPRLAGDCEAIFAIKTVA